ncbi:MAG: saccharopine dehydrogenase family protein [Candidatus Heimdallarchaeaceae archaeon]
MQILCVGGAGKICRESLIDIVATTTANEFSKITITDLDEKSGNEVVRILNDSRVDFKRVDVNETDKMVKLMKQYDIVMDGTTIGLNDKVMSCAAKAKIHGINLNPYVKGFDQEFKDCGKIFIPGVGASSGITNMMVMFACNQLDTVDTVLDSHAAYRPIAYSKAIMETVMHHYGSNVVNRVIFEDGEFKEVPPFGRPKLIDLPKPFGPSHQYIYPSAKTTGFAKVLKNKGVRLIEVRATWPPKTMELIKILHDWGLLRNNKVKVKDVHGNMVKVDTMDVIEAYLLNSPEGRQTELYGYCLHVEVTGTKGKIKVRHILTSSHPPSDGSVPEWEGLRAYTKFVGIPMSIGTQLIARGKTKGTGVVPPETAFDPEEFFAELRKREIIIHDKVEKEYIVA